MTNTIQSERITQLNAKSVRSGKFVLYWMQQSQREHWNHALEYAISRANDVNQPVIVVFGLTANYPEANLRHYVFLLQGLFDIMAALKARGIRMVIINGNPDDVIVESGRYASEIICDRGYTRIQKKWRTTVAQKSDCPVTQIESDVVVPLETVSEKAEYAARTIRPKIHKHLSRFIVPVKKKSVNKPSLSYDINKINLKEILADNRDPINIAECDRIIAKLNLDNSVLPVTRFFHGGFSHAEKKFKAFLNTSLKNYSQNSNQPQTDDISGMSPYLHFGQISPIYLAHMVREFQLPDTSDPSVKEDFLEELIVRRELAANFVHFTTDYDSYDCLPEWAQKTLKEHAADGREYIYTIDDLEQAKTHDNYWNAAMDEMKLTGFMHNYMRMYWGKKVLEWSPSPWSAYNTLMALNNKYFLDGRDANSYAGVAWIFGKHDRAWKEREVFGKVRYMNAAGLERKCDIKGYVQKINHLKGQ